MMTTTFPLFSLPSLSVLIFGASQSIFISILPAISQQLKLDISFLIYIYSLGIFLYFISTLAWGRWIDFTNHKFIFLIGTIGTFISHSFLICALTIEFHSITINLFLFIASRILYALTASSIIPLSQIFHLEMIASKQFKKLSTYSHGLSCKQGLINHSLYLNFGRGLGFLIILICSASPALSLIPILMGLLIILILGLFRVFYSHSLQSIALERFSLTLINASSLDLSFLAFLPTLIFSLMISFLHTGLVKIISRLHPERVLNENHSQILQKTLELSSVLLCGFILVTLLQLILKKLHTYSKLHRPLVLIGNTSLILSIIIFSQINSQNDLYLFISLLSLSVSIIPIHLNHSLYQIYDHYPKIQIASTASSIQTLGNFLGTIILSYTLKNQLLNSSWAILTPLAAFFALLNTLKKMTPQQVKGL